MAVGISHNSRKNHKSSHFINLKHSDPSNQHKFYFPSNFSSSRNMEPHHQHNHDFHQPFPEAAFQPFNPIHANLWRYPRSGGVVNVDPAELGRSREFWGNCVLGFLVDYRLFEADLVNDVIEAKWRTRGNITAFRMGEIYVFHCEDVEDMEGLLARTTVTIDGAVMVFARWYPDSVPRTVRFPVAEVWVRVCGLPFEYMNMHVAHVVGKLLSDQYFVEPFNMVPDNDYLRLRVRINLNEPLMPGFFLALDLGQLLWIQFRYEDIFKYCIKCGKVGHKGIQCRESLQSIVSGLRECWIGH